MNIKLIQFAGSLLALTILTGATAKPSPLFSPAIYMVNTTDFTADGSCDSRHCSLPDAIRAANIHPGLDAIFFNIPGPGPHTIFVGSTPDLTYWAFTDNETLLDATTQPGYSGVPLIILDGGGSSPSHALHGIRIYSGSNILCGLSLINFSGADIDAAIVIESFGPGNNLIENNYIGLNPSGAPYGNGEGVRIDEESGTNFIQNNVISGNNIGVQIYGDYNYVVDNLIGTDPTGSTAQGNQIGVHLDGAENYIGNTYPISGNVISGNITAGVRLESDNNHVFGNKIGTNKGGNSAIPNDIGVSVAGSSNWIGGPDNGSENVIAGNNTGVELLGDSNYVLRNWIGTTAGGGGSIPNEVGIYLSGVYNIVGGGLGTGNRIAHNLTNGILVAGASHAIINDNTITLNGGDGVYLGRGGTDRVSLSYNSMFRNGGLGIKFEAPDVNGGIVPPVITGTTFTSVRGTACPNCYIEIFISDPDPSGYGEGKAYVTKTVSGSDGSFRADFPNVGACKQLTATARHAESTSEFSRNAGVGLCAILPPMMAWIWVLGAAGGGALVLIIIFLPRRPRPLHGPALTVGLGLLGGLLGAGIGVGLLGMPFIQIQWPQEQQAANQAPPDTRLSCGQFLNENLLQPADGAVFSQGTDVFFEFSRQFDPPGMQTRWFIDITGPDKSTISKMLTSNSISLSSLGFDPKQTGFYLWKLRGERLQTGSSSWIPLCIESVQRMFQIEAPTPAQLTPTDTVAVTPTPTLTLSTIITPTFTATSSTPAATLLQNAYCLHGPAVGYGSATTLFQGVQVPIVGRNQDGTWWYVVPPNSQVRCWVAGTMVRTTGNVSGLPVVDTPPLACWVKQQQGPDKCVVPCPEGAKPGGECTP